MRNDNKTKCGFLKKKILIGKFQVRLINENGAKA